MRKLDGIIATCPYCTHDMLVPLQHARLHFVQRDPQQLEMRVSDGSEGAESEEEMLEETATKGEILSASGPLYLVH